MKKAIQIVGYSGDEKEDICTLIRNLLMVEGKKGVSRS
jgi:hypothetical protein